MGTPAPPSLRRGESSHGCNRPFASVDETLTACCLRLGAASATCSCEPKSLSEVTQESWRGSISRFDVAPWTAVRNATESGKETVAALALGRSREGRIRKWRIPFSPEQDSCTTQSADCDRELLKSSVDDT